MLWTTLLLCVAVWLQANSCHSTVFNRSFEIDYANNQFVKDGQPFRYISGTIHYFRVRPEYWRDRLRKLRLAGCNAVQTYVLWSRHEPKRRQYNFNGDLDLLTYIKIAQEEDLLVILRPGPYIDAEIDMGGLPSWLLRNRKAIKLRTNDPTYITEVNSWLKLLLAKLRPVLYANGGPIIMIQIENEFGSYKSCDFAYTAHLRDLTRSVLGDQVVLFTTDGSGTNFLKCGKIPDVYASVDFGTGALVEKAFESQRLFEPRGPLVNSEFYAGWFDHWGKRHSRVNPWMFSIYLDRILSMNASVNIYVFHGGTSFGMLAGSNIIGSEFLSCPTSYDYDAPIDEAGDPTEKFFFIRDILSKYVDVPSGPVPPPCRKYAYGKVQMSLVRNIMMDAQLAGAIHNENPLTFEDLSYDNGVVIYQTRITKRISDPSILSFATVHDRGYVFVDGDYLGMVSRQPNLFNIAIFAKVNQTLSVVVESQGRNCYGDINDWKGFTSAKLAGQPLRQWRMTPVPLESSSALLRENHIIQNVAKNASVIECRQMCIYEGLFDAGENPADTFLRLDGWNKGYAYINDFLLGRYWPVMGPQETLYIPAALMQAGNNRIVIMELEQAPCSQPHSCYVDLQAHHVIDGPTP